MLPDVQVDVNGQQTFYVSLELLASFSGKLKKMFIKSAPLHTRNLKLILHDFPGGAEAFELITRFCYNRGRITYLTPSDALLLHSAANFLEINQDETKKFLENIPFLPWHDLLDCLKQSQELHPFLNSSHFLLREILNAAVDMISMASVTSSSRVFSSSDSCTTDDVSTSSFQNVIHDIEFLSVDLFEEVLSTMISRNLDHDMICSFLIHYQRAKFSGLLSSREKRRIVEVVIASIDGGLKYPFRRLCDVLQKCSSLKVGQSWAEKVERMVGRRLDEATLDDLMVPCSKKNTCAYDVDLVLRLLKFFQRKTLSFRRLKKVGALMDLYLSEVAPDPNLEFSKFLALVLALPASARGSCDKIYNAIDMFFKVHGFVSEEEKIRMCSVLDYEKLSSELLMKLAENNDFPDCVAADALLILQSKLKSSLSVNVVGVNVLCSRSGRLPILCS